MCRLVALGGLQEHFGADGTNSVHFRRGKQAKIQYSLFSSLFPFTFFLSFSAVNDDLQTRRHFLLHYHHHQARFEGRIERLTNAVNFHTTEFVLYIANQ